MKPSNVLLILLLAGVLAKHVMADGVYMPGLNPEITNNAPGINWAPEQPRQHDQMQKWQQEHQRQEQQLQQQYEQQQQIQQQQFRQFEEQQERAKQQQSY